jgi:Zn-dependent protease with chaperone function
LFIRVLRLLGITLVVPAAGLAVGLLAEVDWLSLLSLFGGLIPLILVTSQLWLAHAAGRDRAAMARIFPGLARTTVYGMVAMVAVQTVVAIAALWIGETMLIQRVHVGLMIGLALGAGGAGLGLAQAALASGRRPTLFAVGQALTEAESPRLFAHVRDLARRLGAHAPEHIVVGVDANFYVTSADVRLLGDSAPLQGETLYISSALARLFTPEELDAVLGHELGHFRGDDTAYSLKFAPVYAGLRQAMGELLDRNGRVPWMAAPALYVLGLLHDLFAEAETAVSRERELEADRAGVQAAGAEAMALALMKVALHADAWEEALAAPRALEHESADGSLPLAFARTRAGGWDAAVWREALEAGLGEPVAHPIDTHPPVRARLAAIGVDPGAVNLARLAPPKGRCGADLIEGLEVIERTLSQVYLDAAGPPFAARSVLSNVADGVGDPQPR